MRWPRWAARPARSRPWTPATLLGQLDAVTAAEVPGCAAGLLDRLVVASAGDCLDPDAGTG
jgi:hypothetical protein